jgi:hypothetical protein
MSDNKNAMLMEVFFRHIGEAHAENLVKELETHREEIDKIVIPKSFDDWFWKFSAAKQKEERRKAIFKQMRYIAAKAAVVAIVLLASLSIVTLSVKSVRAKIFEFFTNIYEQFTDVNPNNDYKTAMANIKWDSFYYPTYIPEGFRFNSYEMFGFIKMISFKKDNILIQLHQTSNMNSIRLDTEDAAVTKVIINGFDGLLIVKEGRSIIFWNNGVTYFYIVGIMSENDAIKMAKSLIKNQ